MSVDAYTTLEASSKARSVSLAKPISAPQNTGLEATPVSEFRLGDWRKRGLDISAASVGLVVLLPAFIFIAVLIRLSSSGQIIYGHERIGRGGRPFKCLKFRTMVPNGDEVLRAHLASSESARLEWEANRKLKSDPRVTPIGAILRATSADELPQLINVLRGEMSLVGPRPIVHDELRYYGPFSSHYLATKPGITGLWQVSGRSNVTYDQRVKFDVEYCESWSFLKDIVIIVRTVPALISREGTY
jgi:exopolysaccharide production protein ExoY